MSELDARAIKPGDATERVFPQVDHAFRIHLAEAAFDHATARGQGTLDREIGGILVGEVCVTACLWNLHAKQHAGWR